MSRQIVSSDNRCPSSFADSTTEATFDEIRAHGRFEHDFFFLSQLYDLQWNPVPTI
jgi:hypothetical protein